MKTSVVAGSLLSVLSLVSPLAAQQVGARVLVRSGPVLGRVAVGPEYSTYRRAERVVVVERAPTVIVVERVHHARYARRAWRREGFRRVTLWYRDGRYYDRDVRGWGLREVVVYERNGRFYRACGNRHDDRDRDD